MVAAIRTSGARRDTASAINGLSLTSARTCFGRAGEDSGQNREPMPPARMTAQSSPSTGVDSAGTACSAVTVARDPEGCEEKMDTVAGPTGDEREQ